jgi:two-component system OmpR family sensor kinase
VSIKWRLTLSFGLMLAIAAAIAVLFFYAAFQQWVISMRIDTRLTLASGIVEATLSADTAEELDLDLVHSTLTSLSDPDSPEIWAELIDSGGTVLVKSDNLGERELPVLTGTSEIPITATSMEGNRLRILSAPLLVGGKSYQLEYAQSLASIDKTMSSMGLILLLTTLVVLTLAVICTALVIGRALSPVKKVTATAKSITSSSDLTRRVNYRGPRDEIGELAATFDLMIEQIDGLLRSQRSFVADASHELRGPLTVVRGNLDLLKRDLGEEDRQESLRALEAETDRMARVVNDLLVLAEVESGPLEQQQMVSLKEIVLDAQDRALLLAGSRQILIGRQDDLWVKGDAHKLDQMVNNAVSNAVKYTPDGGTITLSLYQEGDWARLDVADTGIGIAPEHLPHLFDRFYRVDKARSRAGGGTGLGLAIVKGIAEQHGGRVAVTSELGKGSTFTVWLRLN